MVFMCLALLTIRTSVVKAYWLRCRPKVSRARVPRSKLSLAFTSKPYARTIVKTHTLICIVDMVLNLLLDAHQDSAEDDCLLRHKVVLRYFSLTCQSYASIHMCVLCSNSFRT
jgi:hypothetical protein